MNRSSKLKKVFIRTLLVALMVIHVGNLAAQEKKSVFDSVSTSVTYTADLLANTMGGFDTGLRYFDNLDVEVEAKWSDFTLFVYGLANQGGSISELAGDFQAISNIEAENSWRIFEAWANIPIQPIKSSILIGLYDLNSEFDEVNTSRLFINSSHDIGPDLSFSGVTGPSVFPLSSLGVRFKTNLIPGITIKGAVLDAVPSDPTSTSGTKVRLRESEGTLMIGEVSWFKQTGGGTSIDRGVNEDSPFRVAVGLWQYSEEREGWNGEMELDAGFYALAEARVFSEKSDREQGLSLFGRFGAVNKDINRFSQYIGAGFSYTGLLPGRDQDQFGIATSLPINSDPFLDENRLDLPNELITEVTYLWKVTEFFNLQLDAQYIANPNQAENLEDALVVGIRTSIGF